MSDVIGSAVLVTVNVEDPATLGAMWEGPFVERHDDAPHAHPIARAWALWESIKNDWPGFSAAVLANERAKDLATAHRMAAMGFDYDESLAGGEK